MKNYFRGKTADRLFKELVGERKVGKWIYPTEDETTISGICSACGWEAHYYEDDVAGMPYCPNCGAKMEEQ